MKGIGPLATEILSMQPTIIGLDLAKLVFQVHGVDERGKTVLTKRLRREGVLRHRQLVGTAHDGGRSWTRNILWVG